MIEIPSEADIFCPVDDVFAIIADFTGQDRWLPRSSSFRGTVDMTENPVLLGTTYREPGPLGVRNGMVTEYDPPTRLTFHQPMTLRFGLGTLDVVLRYVLTPGPESTHVRRVVTLGVPWRPVKVLQAVVVREFRTESARTLAALKEYADGLGSGAGA